MGQDYSRAADGVKFTFAGLDTVHQTDSMPPGKYPLAINVRAYLQDVITPRLPQSAALVTVANSLVHSLRRLNYTTQFLGAGYVFIIGAGTALYVNAASVVTSLSGRRLTMVAFRPDASPQPWMYVIDWAGQQVDGHSVGTQVKVTNTGPTYNIGIAEPQTEVAVGGAPATTPPAVTSPLFYRYIYRSTLTGAKSNPSPPMRVGYTVTTLAPLLVLTFSADPQVNIIDVFRFDGALLDYTYVGSHPNSGSALFIDSLSDAAAAAAANPLLEFDNFQPFPSIDFPKSGVVQVTGANTLTYVSGDIFSPAWLPGNVINLNIVTATLYNRPTHPTMQVLEDLTAYIGTNLNWSISQPTFAAEVVPAWWGPTDNAGYFFACGDPLRAGTLYFTKGNNPDSAPDTNQIEVTSPSEPLIGGCIVGGLGMVFSSERAWLIYPNFSQAVATVVGVQGSPFNLVESISERGLFVRHGICTNGGGWVYYIAKDGIRKSPAGSGSSSITDDDLYNLFPHEGIPQKPYNILTYSGGVPTVLFTISPPDYTNTNGMFLSFSQGYLYFDYVGLDAARHTLVYDTIHNGWAVDVYGVPVSVHADNEGEYTNVFTPTTVQTGIGSLMGCSTDGTVRDFDPTASESGNMTILTPAYNNGDRRSTKRFGDIFIESSVPTSKTAFTAKLYSEKFANQLTGVIAPTLYPQVVDGIRHGDVAEVNTGQGVYAKDIELSFEIPINSVGAQIFTWQPALVPQPETTGQRNTDWDDGGTNGAKFVQGVIIEADSFNVAKSFTAQSGDDDSIHAFAEMGAGIVFNGQSKRALSFAVPFVAHNFRIVPNSVAWNLFKVEWIFVPYPELVKEWHTEGTSHGLPGWQHVKELNIAHLSTADLTLTLIRDFGSPIVVTVPNSGGIQTKTLVQVPPPSKFKIVSYNITSTQAFKLWVEDLEVFVVDWESDGGYKLLRPFGGPSALKALV